MKESKPITKEQLKTAPGVPPKPKKWSEEWWKQFTTDEELTRAINEALHPELKEKGDKPIVS